DLADLHKENPAQFPQRLQRAIDALRQTEPAYPAAVESEPDAGKEPARLVADKLEFFLTIPTPVKRYLLRPLISSPSLGMVYGPRGIGKSHFVDAVAYGTAAGDRFLVWSAEYPIKTIMIDGEMPVSVQQERFTLQIKAFEKEAPPGYLQIVSAERQGETGIPDLARPEGQRAIESILGDCELLILDNLSSLVRSGVENEGESWLPLQTWLLSLRRRGVSVLLVHHSNKLGDQRGTSRREDVLDYILSLRRPRDYDPQQGCAFEVHFTKARGLWGKEVRAINARFETDPHGVASRWVWSYADDTLLVDVAEMATEGMSLAQIGKTLGMSKTAVHRRLEKAKQEGLYPIK
nr:AAA family ATPase [bacterium]